MTPPLRLVTVACSPLATAIAMPVPPWPPPLLEPPWPPSISPLLPMVTLPVAWMPSPPVPLPLNPPVALAPMPPRRVPALSMMKVCAPLVTAAIPLPPMV
ncbi:hypothetical protein [Rhodanobacter sp. 115]|uniref:hypothetical protein n=1 Tax=Rhodanobacter sp. FW021-MT20 TaxID=1162282 RepID=UPI00067FE46F|nr:hypothetical protein [Rhodanobacter sp. 115]